MGEKPLPQIERTIEVLLGDSGYTHLTSEAGKYHLKVRAQKGQRYESLGADEEGTEHHIIYDPKRVNVLIENIAMQEPDMEESALTPEGVALFKHMAQSEGYDQIIQTRDTIMALRLSITLHRFAR